MTQVIYPVRGEVILRVAIEDANDLMLGKPSVALQHYIALTVEQTIRRDAERLTVDQFLSSREGKRHEYLNDNLLPRQFDPTDQDPT